MTKALYRKWRPKDWNEVASQEHVIQTLRNAVVNDRVAHAYLFAGPRGTGKTTTARLLAKAVNCLEPDLAKRPCNQCDFCLSLNAGRFLDLIEIDAASNTSVDDVRDLRDKISFSPSQGKYKVYIIDEVHMLSTAAFNALLKTLEEPPPHAIFILATTEIHKIPATVLSRCQRHEFRRIPPAVIVSHLKTKSKEEGHDVEDAVYSEIARQATGSLRDAISLLDQLTSTNEHITLEIAQKVLGTATNLRVLDIVDALLDKDAGKGLLQIDLALDSGTDPRQLSRQIVTYLRNVLLFKMGNDINNEVSEEVKLKIAPHANQFTMAGLIRAIESFNQATVEEQANWHPGLGLELAFTSYLTVPETTRAEPEQTAKSGGSESEESAKPSSKPTPAYPKKKKKADPKPTEKQPVKKNTPESEEQEPKPKEKKPEVEPSPQTIVEGEISINNIHRNWQKIKSMVGKHNRRTEGMLNSSKLIDTKENTLILGFNSAILKNMMEKEGNINLTMDILEEVCGQPVLIRCIVTTHEGNPLPDDIVIEKDGMVGTATRDLGGKISNADPAE